MGIKENAQLMERWTDKKSSPMFRLLVRDIEKHNNIKLKMSESPLFDSNRFRKFGQTANKSVISNNSATRSVLADTTHFNSMLRQSQ